MTKKKEIIVPKTANTFDKICNMKRDNTSTGRSWMSIEENHVNIVNQKNGHNSTGEVRLSKKEFEKFIRFYETGQVSPPSITTKSKDK